MCALPSCHDCSHHSASMHALRSPIDFFGGSVVFLVGQLGLATLAFVMTLAGLIRRTSPPNCKYYSCNLRIEARKEIKKRNATALIVVEVIVISINTVIVIIHKNECILAHHPAERSLMVSIEYRSRSLFPGSLIKPMLV